MNTFATLQKAPTRRTSRLQNLVPQWSQKRIGARTVSGGSLLVVLLPLIGMHLLGVRTFYWLDLRIVPWDFAILISGVIVATFMMRGVVSVPERLPAVFYILIGITVWFAIEAARSPDLFRGWTMVLLLLRDIAMFCAIFIAVRHRPTTEQLALWVAVVGVLFTVLAIVLFLTNLDMLGERLPFDGIILLVEDTAPRIIGLARDPNFFGLTAILSLMAIPFALRVPIHYRWLGAAIVLTAVFFTGSRMLPASLFTGTAVLIAVLLIRRQTDPIRQLLFTLVPGTFIAILLVPIWFMIPVGSTNLGSALLSRYQLGAASPRTELWSQVIEDIGSDPGLEGSDPSRLDQVEPWLFGNGLRSNQDALGGQYSHNSYLDLLGETGLIGLVMWVVLTGVITVQGFRTIAATPAITPWLATWLVMLIFLAGFSLVTAPYYWFIAAIIAGMASYSRMKQERNLPKEIIGPRPVPAD